MLRDNIKAFRKSKGLSQEELAERLNVVRQTVSKWETGLSVPDADLLISLAEVFDTPVSTLLGENVTIPDNHELAVLAEELERINLQLADRKNARRKWIHAIFLFGFIAVVVVLVALYLLGSPYLAWDYGNAEIAVAGTLFHAFEFVFVRMAPFLLIACAVGIFMTRRK